MKTLPTEAQVTSEASKRETGLLWGWVWTGKLPQEVPGV